jgi:phosphoribosylformylglycinamidine synthase
VSFYNDTLGASIPPTPVVAMVGIVADAAHTASVPFKAEAEAILLAGAGSPELEASEYLKVCHGLTGDRPPRLDLSAEKALAEFCVRVIESGLVTTAHDIADGGFAVALAEMSLLGTSIGCSVELPESKLRADVELFGECGARAILSCPQSRVAAVEAEAQRLGVPLRSIGTTGGSKLRISRAATVLVDRELVELNILLRMVLLVAKSATAANITAPVRPSLVSITAASGPEEEASSSALSTLVLLTAINT